jgi:type II secretory pathway pseudopilin PulG
MAAKNSKRMRRAASIPTESDARGYAMAVLLVAMAVMLTLMTVAMPVWRQQQKREREEELLFRLKQYAHALVLYQRRLPGAAPANLDDLVKERFLRKKYKDPMTGNDFAILRVGQVSPGMTTPLPGMTPGGAGAAGTTTRPGQPSVQGPGPGLSSQPGSGPASGMSPNVRPGGVGSSGATAGAIRGVVSTSKDSSLRVWKGRTQYDQWEVSVDDITPRVFGAQTPQPGQNQAPGGRSQSRPGQIGPGQTPSSPPPNNPYGGPIRR